MTDIRRYAYALLLGSALLLSACGFQLRGSAGQANLPFKTVYVQVANTSSLGNQLKRYITAGDTALATDPKTAQAVIDILSESKNKQVLSVNSQGRVREYTLLYQVRFQVRDPAGKDLLPPTDLTVRRIQTFNESLVLAKETEETSLYRDMQSDLVQQMMRRLAAIKPQ